MGAVVNSFAEIRPATLSTIRESVGNRAGSSAPPLSQSPMPEEVSHCAATATPASSAKRARCLSWLSTQEKKSVVYACFGSWNSLTGEQLQEVALGLEAAGGPFLWVLRKADGEEWMPQQRVEGRGLVMRGWAPQVDVLAHEATGAFVTHCGWNSLLEGAAAGLPMVTWPLAAEQFVNEKLVLGVLQVGVRASEQPGSTAEAERRLVRAVRRVMGGGGEEAEGIRKRVEELGEKARVAVAKGGSSDQALSDLINEIRAWHRNVGVGENKAAVRIK